MIWLLLFAPLAGFALNGIRLKSSNRGLSGLIGVSGCAISFLAALFYVFAEGFAKKTYHLADWIQAGGLEISFSFRMDSLSLLMTLLITGAGLLIHLYSWGYMIKDSGFTRYFAYLNLFIFMMLILVLADSLPLLFAGWEGVGLCSYLLIGFWFKDKEKTKSGFLAFITNRIGDVFFLLGMFLLFGRFGSLHFAELNSLFSEGLRGLEPLDFKIGELAALFLFLGAAGKSAQIPFYFWLPKAMAGPTPVSALIHAATMVTAGVYLISRLSLFYSAFPALLQLISWIGAATALGAAAIACRQNDLKSILAYSTISQLAYLFIAAGAKAFSAGIFHLLTHGFFKALLFLCAASIIQALKGEQNIRRMGGLRKQMPLVFAAFMAGAMALAAIPPFSGFFSKDEIIWSLFSSGRYGLYFAALAAGLMTAFYMARLTVLVFFGEKRFKEDKLSEGGGLMRAPLVVFALLSLFGGLLGIPHLFSSLFGGAPHILHELLAEISPVKFEGSKASEAFCMLRSALGVSLAAGLAGWYYMKKKKSSPSAWKLWLEEAFFIQTKFLNPIQSFFVKSANFVFQHLEQNFLQKAIGSLPSQALNIRARFSSWQNGNLQSYAVYFSIGLCFLIILIFLR